MSSPKIATERHMLTLKFVPRCPRIKFRLIILFLSVFKSHSFNIWKEIEEICRKTVSHGQTVKLNNLVKCGLCGFNYMYFIFFPVINRNFQMAFLKWMVCLKKLVIDCLNA